MDAARFDRLTHRHSMSASRRHTLTALLLGALGLTAAGLPGEADARKRKRKLELNQFGCVDVGGKCRGNDAVCCSGICQGKKPKKGKRDRSRCVAHDTGTLAVGEGGCRVEDDSCPANFDTRCTTTTGDEDGRCFRTTGNAGYCLGIGNCVPCTKDTECIETCGAGAACIFCPGDCPGSDSVCGGTTAC